MNCFFKIIDTQTSGKGVKHSKLAHTQPCTEMPTYKGGGEVVGGFRKQQTGFIYNY